MGKDGILKLIIVPGLVVLLMFIVFSPVLAEEALTLEEALRLGIENNIAIKESEIEKRKAEIDLDSARRAVLPEITFSTSYTRLYLDEDDNMRGLPVVPQDPFGIGEILAQMMAAMQPEEDNYQTAISVQQPIYLGGKLMIARQQAEKALELTELQQRQKENELLLNIIQSYYNVLLAEERVRIEEEALELIREHKRIAEVSYKAGLSLKTDLLQVEIEENKAILSLERARNDLAMARRLFANMIGSDIGDRVFLAPEFLPEPLLDKELALSLARENRVEFKLLDINQDILDLSLKMETSTYLPNIVLVGNYQWQGSELKFEDGNASITLALSMNIFDKGLARNSRMKLNEELNKVVLNKDNLEELLAIDLENQLLRIEENLNNIRLQRLNLQRAEENLALEEKRFEAGTGTNMEVLNAGMVLKTTRIASIQAEYQYEISLYQLLEKTGRLIDYCKEVILNEK